MNDLYYIEYKPELMLCDSMDMDAATELAHRRLCDFIWRMDKAPKFDVNFLVRFTKCDADSWPEICRNLIEKGWEIKGDVLVHQGVVESHNAAKVKYAQRCNQAAPATAKKTGLPIKLYSIVTDAVTGIATLITSTSVTDNVTTDVTNNVTKTVTTPQLESESKPELPKTDIRSQTKSIHPKTNGLNLTFAMLERVSREIVTNKRDWYYDNHKLTPDDLSQAGIVGALKGYVGRVSEAQAHEAWQEAATRTHRALVDGMPISSKAAYAVGCWKEQLTNIAEKVNGSNGTH